MSKILRTVLIALMAVCFFMAFAEATPFDTEPAAEASQAACLPASCQSYGCCSGDCGYWCRACDVNYVC
ncbi:hypothetical protein HA402_001903 [Bradysia odoriphaga]|nr:hypothetical protein HA402_001903 [Bradysia odoriphaga]